MAFKEFSGELDAAPKLTEFSGELDRPEPTLKDRIYKVANNLFGRGSVMDEFNPSSAVSANPVMADMAQQSAGRVFSKNAAAQTPTLQASDAKIVSGIPGVIEVGARKGYAGLGRIEAGTIKAIADTFDSDTLHAIADGQTRYADQVENGAILRKDPVAGFSGESIVQDLPNASANAIGSVLQTAPTLAAGAINPAAALPILFGTTAMQEYGEGRQSGLNPAGAGIRAIPMAAMEVIGEKLGGFDKIAKGLNAATRGNGVAGLGSAMASSAIKEIPGEEITTTGQFLTDKLPGVGLNQEAGVDDFKKAVKDTALATLLQSGAMGVGGKVLQSAGGSAPAAPVTQPQPAPEKPVPDAATQANTLASAINLSSLIKQTATQDSKLNTGAAPKMVEAPDDIKLDAAPSINPAAPEVNPLAPSIPQDADKILQNRNRATPSSIAQMTSIAANPDYNRLSFSRDFANGAPVVSGGVIPESQLGVSDIAVASDGRRIPIQYAVVDASELLPSNTADGSINEAYGDNQIDAVRAIAGNGRVAGLQEAYIKDTAGTYRDELAADTLHGVDAKVIAGMANPVLVRVMPQESVTADIGDVSNTVGNLELSPVEQANNDVQRVNLEALEFAEDGAVTPKSIRQFVQAMPQAEQGSLLDTNGQPTKQAADRLNAAIFAKAYANDELIRLYAQAQDPEARIVLSALAQVAPKMARLEGAGALDIRQAITDAAYIAVNARRTGLSITRAAQQVDMTADSNVVDVLTLFAANTRSSKAIAEALGRAADFAYSEAIKPEEGLFGIEPKASRQEVFDKLRNADEAGSQENMELAQGGKSVQEDAARGGYQRPGQADAQGAEAGRPADDTNLRQQPAGYGNDGTDYGLESYTNRDIIERLDRIEKTQKEAAELARAEEAKRQADLERDRFGLTGSESPMDRLESQGQGRLFQPIDEYTSDQAIKAQDSYGRPDLQKAGSSDAPISGLSEFIPGQQGSVNQESVTIPVSDQSDTYVKQRDLFLDYLPVESQDGQGGETAKRQAVSAMDDLRSSSSVLGRTLSSDYAARQRVSLVGQRVDSAEDLATLAQVYRDPRFETFRLVFTNDAGRVVSQLGLTSRLPTSTQAIIGDDAEAYLKEVSKVAKERGATRYWMLHNHPSGMARPSSADLKITRYFTEAMPALSNQGHVVIDTNEYAFIDPFATGEYDVRAKDFGAVEPMTAGEFSMLTIGSPAQLMAMAKKLDVDKGAVTLVSVDAQSRVRRISSVPSSAFTDDKSANHRIMLKESLSNNTFRVFIIGRDIDVLKKASWHATDSIIVHDDGSVATLMGNADTGALVGMADIYPESRRTRLSPDSSNEFDYLRNVPTAKELAAVREEEQSFGPVLTQYQGDTKGAIAKLSELKTGDAVGAISHPDIGDVDLIWGKEGSAKNNYRDGFGLAKIAIKHPEVLNNLQEIVAGMRITTRSSNRINLESATHKGAVRLEWNGQKKTWLLTAFEKVADGASTRTDTARLDGEGDTARSAAAASSIVANGEQNASSLKQDAASYSGQENPQEAMNVPPPGHKFEPLRASDFWSAPKGKTGRRQYEAGRKLWERLDAYAGEYLGKLKLADTKPGAFKEMLRQFNVDKTKASQQAKRIAETGMSLTPEQRELISDIVEKQVKVGDATPEEITGLASTMVAALDVQSRELVELGMLSEERLVKNYLPRLYKSGLSGMLTNPTLMRSWFTKARMRIRGDRLHSRGMFAEIDSGKVEQAKRLGWKVSSMPGGDPVPGDLLAAIDAGNDIPGQYRDSKVLMWRDYTESERQQMGEVRDGVLRYALGYVETQKDIAIGRLFKAIANNPDLAKSHNPGGWVKVPDQEISGAPGTKAYGALSGMWVEPQVADSLKRNTQPKGMLMAAYDKALSFWKEGKTVWNPVSHGNNVVSNLFTIYFAGLNPANPKLWRETLREYRVKGEFYTEALDNGLFGNEWANKEIQDLLMPDFADMADMESVAASRVSKMVEFAKKTGKPVSWYRENMQKAYEFEDQFFKLMLYIDRRKAGMNPQEAITDAERYVFNYADMPEGVELIKRMYSPFFAYTYKAIPMVLHTAMTRPDRMLAPIMLLGGANWLAYMFLGADEEEERKAMPEFMAGRTAIGTQKAVRLPFNIDDRPAFLDMSRRVPLGDLFDMNNQTGGAAIPAPFMPSHPVLTLLQAIVWNQDTFTGKKLVKDSDTAWEAAQTRAGYFAKQITPNAPFVPGSFNFNKLMDATAYTFDTEIGPYTGYTKSGDPVRPSTVIPDVFTGTKIRSFDIDKSMAYKNADLNKEAAEIRANIKAANKNKSMSESFRERYIESQREKLERLGERRSDLNQ